MTQSTPGADGHSSFFAVRERLARELLGRGVEFGPGCHPLPLGPFVQSIEYCDAYDRAGFLEKFPEAAPGIAGFPERVAYRINFDREPFVDLIGEGSLDFVVANHVLEHLVNPLSFLVQCHRLLKPGGIAYIALPDKRLTFDRYRRRTPLSDVVGRYRSNATVVDEARIVEFINQTDIERLERGVRLGFGPSASNYQRAIKQHRDRSIHVNVWMIDDFVEVLTWLGRELSRPFELLDGACHNIEFAFVLRKAERADATDRYPLVLSRIFAESHLAALRQQLGALEQAFAQNIGREAPSRAPASSLKAAVVARFPRTAGILRRLRSGALGGPGRGEKQRRAA
jgi:SAM-dependent methyltransferase